ncbi:MAG: phosphoribosylformylglycinamidine synthase [Oscillospiraceae bacterium]|nr:phosphoribosylformylglycinamidine synthase [Oscillospiraceae bacterium]
MSESLNKVFRIYVEKKRGFDQAASALQLDLTEFLGVKLEALRLFLRYDIMGISEDDLPRCLPLIFSEPVSDTAYLDSLPDLPGDTQLVAYEALPGQFDMRADSCAQCVQMLVGGNRPQVRCADIIAITGISPEDAGRVSEYVINKVECCPVETDKPKPCTLNRDYPQPAGIPVLTGFRDLPADQIKDWIAGLGLAMDREDALFMQSYFRGEDRDPTLTEVKVLDTYWSDHCRHTTFLTEIENIEIEDSRARQAYDLYQKVRDKSKPVTLMGIATAAMKHLRGNGKLPGLDESEEINACTVRVKVDTDAGEQDWLMLFKNETHNHPTEIEPFGGAATCIGGAIRDPLSGRAYVYQAMRITGAADPRMPMDKAIPGKIPQRKLTQTAAAGYSSYGNQIGLATGLVREVYHPGYVAKRMEVGAVIGAVPSKNVKRETPVPGDVVLLLGGRTGRDGIGGATGSSKSHSLTSIEACFAEVQKGNAPEERKLQRFFRNKEVSLRIKRCNDFGAGGVAVAVGELANGLEIDLDAMTKKYEGLDGTELALSESQERMAVVVSPEDIDFFQENAAKENIECAKIAEVTQAPRLVMKWKNQVIVDIARDFLDTAGSQKTTCVKISATAPSPIRAWENEDLTVSERLLLLASDLNFCSQKGLQERFDSSIGAGSVLAPFGSESGNAPEQVMAALFPAPGSRTASVMSWAFDPYINGCFDSAVYSVAVSLAKLIAAGCPIESAWLTLQEYFPRLGRDPERWGWPAGAVLGAFWVQMGLEVAAIGGKDSMSGSFENLDVPPTLISFAVASASASDIIPSYFTRPNRFLCLAESTLGNNGFGDMKELKNLWKSVTRYIKEGKITAAYACELGGVPGALAHMSLSGIGACIERRDYNSGLWAVSPGSIVVECSEPLDGLEFLGKTQQKPELQIGTDFIPLASLAAAWAAPLEKIFPTAAAKTNDPQPPAIESCVPEEKPKIQFSIPNRRPKAVIPVFPGTNCEYDTMAALEAAGGEAECVLVRNLTPEWLSESVSEMRRALRRSQMLIIPGGFSGGDEPAGSAKFIASFFSEPGVAQEVQNLLDGRQGLILGICNGFQALVKLGLLPSGQIRLPDESFPALTFNSIGRHQARYVHTRMVSAISPWLSACRPGDVYTIPISHGEGRFYASQEMLQELAVNNQIAFQYCDIDGNIGLDTQINPAGSVWAIEGISSPDGRVLGKMGHTERAGRYIGKNVPGNKIQPIFEGGVKYFA